MANCLFFVRDFICHGSCLLMVELDVCRVVANDARDGYEQSYWAMVDIYNKVVGFPCLVLSERMQA